MPDDLVQTRDGFATSPVGHWVGCLWNFESGDGHPHPDDADLIQRLCPYNLTAEYVAVDEMKNSP
jgi:hypothetical protein